MKKYKCTECRGNCMGCFYTELCDKWLDLYVTGLTVALISVLNACRELEIEVTLYHYDRESGNYYPQQVL